VRAGPAIEAIATPAAQKRAFIVAIPAMALTSNGYRWDASVSVVEPAQSQFIRHGLSVEANRTIYLAFVYDGSTVQLYSDGKPATSPLVRRDTGASTDVPVTSVDGQPKSSWFKTSYIGRLNPTPNRSEFFDGLIHEVRISNVARKSSELQPRQRFEADDKTIALYHFDEGSGTVLRDSSGNGNHGKIEAADWVDVASAVQPTPVGSPVDTNEVGVIARDGLDWIPGLLDSPASPTGVRRWQLDTTCPRATCHDITWSPRGDMIAVAVGSAIHIRDAESLELRHILLGHNYPVTSVSWHRDGTRLVSLAVIQKDEHLVWDLDERQVQVHTHPPFGRHIAVSPKADILAMAGWAGRLILFDLAGNEVFRTGMAANSRSSMACAWSPDGNRVALWRSDGIYIFDADERSQQPVSVLTSPVTQGIKPDSASHMAWIGLDRIAINTLYGGPPAIIDITTDTAHIVPVKDEFRPRHVGVTASGRVLFAGSLGYHEGVCLSVDSQLAEPTTIDVASSPAICVATSPDKSRFVIGSTEGTVSIYGNDGTFHVSTRPDANARQYEVKWNASSSRLLLLVASFKGSRSEYFTWHEVWSPTGERSSERIGFPAVRGNAWKADGSEFAVLQKDQDIHIYDQNGQLIRNVGLPPKPSGYPLTLDWHPTRDAFAVGNTNGSLMVFDNGQVTELGTDVSPRLMAFSRDGQNIVTAALDGTVTRWLLDGTQESVGRVSRAPASMVEGDDSSWVIADNNSSVILTPDGRIEKLPSIGVAFQAVGWTKEGTIIGAGLVGMQFPRFVEMSRNGEVLRQRRLHSEGVRSLSIGRKNNLMVTSGGYDARWNAVMLPQAILSGKSFDSVPMTI
jgi:WD40 repeat protein